MLQSYHIRKVLSEPQSIQIILCVLVVVVVAVAVGVGGGVSREVGTNQPRARVVHHT